MARSERHPLATRQLRAAWALAFGLVGCGGPEPGPNPPPPPPVTIPITGQAVPALSAMDNAISDLIRTWQIPGAAVAVTYQERLVYARGFGYADTLARRQVQPDALFRIASVSKPITAVTVLRLVDEGKLALDAKALDLIPDLMAPAGTTEDPRLGEITIRQLLWHVGGWDRDRSGDPVFQNAQIALSLGVGRPASAEDVIRYMRGRPLDFDPGSRYVYSNFGYMVLGRIIERVTGQDYESYVRGSTLAAAGITRMQVGHSRATERTPGEVTYYDLNTGPSVYPDGGMVPAPDGAFYLESMDSHGGWIASAVDLVKFVTGVDGQDTRPDLIPSALFLPMLSAPPGAIWTGAVHYGLGWLVRPDPGNWWHNGSLPGTASFVARYANGVTVAAVFNARAMTPSSAFESQVDPTLGNALGAVSSWPAHDLFSQFP
ncbi:MAG: serine hydrolase domain-containing protein [Gemmatimonadales bacterium]